MIEVNKILPSRLLQCNSDELSHRNNFMRPCAWYSERKREKKCADGPVQVQSFANVCALYLVCSVDLGRRGSQRREIKFESQRLNELRERGGEGKKRRRKSPT